MDNTYTPYASRQGYEDLLPLPQQDYKDPLVPIAYTLEYSDAMSTFRALVARSERSHRTLEVTERLIRLNPGHYSIWAYRAETLLATDADLSLELDLMDQLVKAHIKSYQVWQHRRTIILALNSPLREIPFTSRALSFDSKNYHTWAYRQWVLGHFYPRQRQRCRRPSGSEASDDKEKDKEKEKEKEKEEEHEEVWRAELDYTTELLEQDPRNNSAWNHRFFVVFESGGAGAREESDAGAREESDAGAREESDGERGTSSDRGDAEGGASTSSDRGKREEVAEGEEEEVIEREIRYTKRSLARVPNNPSAWNYLRGILTHSSRPLSSLSPFVRPLALAPSSSAPEPEPQPETEFPISKEAQLPAVGAIEWLADAAAQDAEAGAEEQEQGHDEGKKEEAAALFRSLVQFDPIRTHYWNYRAEEVLALNQSHGHGQGQGQGPVRASA